MRLILEHLDLPPSVIEDIRELSGIHRVDLNSIEPLGGGFYRIGYPPTGLTLIASRGGARFMGHSGPATPNHRPHTNILITQR